MNDDLFESYMHLRKEFEPLGTVRIIEKADIDDEGEYHFDSRIIYINIDAEDKTEVLIHEAAHVLDMDENDYTEDVHRDSWGAWYARVYRHVYG